MSDIEIGNHVVCIDGKFPTWVSRLYKYLPIEGTQYVVRDVLLGVKHPQKEGTVRILLVGLVNPSPNGKAMNERGFDIRRFRKLEEVKATGTEPKVEKRKTFQVGKLGPEIFSP